MLILKSEQHRERNSMVGVPNVHFLVGHSKLGQETRGSFRWVCGFIFLQVLQILQDVFVPTDMEVSLKNISFFQQTVIAQIAM